MSILLDPSNCESLKPKLSSAAIVGHTTATSSRIWIRVYREGLWHLVVSPCRLTANIYNLDDKTIDACTENINSVVKVSHDFSSDSDLTHCFDVVGLQPDTRYYYYLIADDSIPNVGRRVEMGSDHQHWLRTFPENMQTLIFGFYSCHDPFSVKPHNEGIWEKFYQVLNQRKAHFVIGGGDQVYCDSNNKFGMQDIWLWLKNNKAALIKQYTYCETGELDRQGITEYFIRLYRMYYRSYWCFEYLLSVYRRYPQYMIWDDHEIMDGWGSLTKDERKEKISHWLSRDDEETNYLLVQLMFRAASFVYHEYQHSHNPQTPINLLKSTQCQWDYGFCQGDFAVYALDVRGHHDVERSEYRLLGKEQFTRVQNWLNTSEVQQKKAVFIISPVPIVHWNETFVNVADFGRLKDDFMDEWGHESNHQERNQLLDSLLGASQHQDQTIVVLSGDVHCASAFKISHATRFPNARLFNVTSSAISRAPAPTLSVVAVQKSAPIDSYPGGRFEQLHRFSGENNFALVNADVQDGELSLSVTLYWDSEGDDELCQKVLWLQ